MRWKKVLKEIKILQILSGGPNIIQLYDIVQDENTKTVALVIYHKKEFIYLKIFEYVDDYEWKTLYPKLTDMDVRFYMYKILEVITPLTLTNNPS